MNYTHSPASDRTDLTKLAETIVVHLREHFPDSDHRVRQVLCLAEEAGEFVGAYRRFAGMARRSGPWEDVKAELADVVITAYVAAQFLGIASDALENARDSIGEPTTRDEVRQVSAVFRAVADFVDACDRLVPSTTLLTVRLAAVINVACATAQVLGIDLDEAVRAKSEEIMSRGWRDEPAEVSQ